MIEVRKPVVKLLHATPLEITEIATRLCYDSFDKSESENIKQWRATGILNLDKEFKTQFVSKIVNAYQHSSIVEHIYINFYLSDISRGVLQELARHRIASFSVRSTRYTMGDLISIITFYYLGYMSLEEVKAEFIERGVFVFTQIKRSMEAADRFIDDVMSIITGDVYKYLSKAQLEYLESDKIKDVDTFLSLPKKRNIGDPFKMFVTDAWSTELVFTINLRSLKNFLKLRDSGSAYIQIRDLAKAIKEVVPNRYLDVIGVKYE